MISYVVTPIKVFKIIQDISVESRERKSFKFSSIIYNSNTAHNNILSIHTVEMESELNQRYIWLGY